MQCVIGAPLFAGIGVSKSLWYLHSNVRRWTIRQPSKRLLQVMSEWAKLLGVVRKGVRRRARWLRMRTEWAKVLGVGRGIGVCVCVCVCSCVTGWESLARFFAGGLGTPLSSSFTLKKCMT